MAKKSKEIKDEIGVIYPDVSLDDKKPTKKPKKRGK